MHFPSVYLGALRTVTAIVMLLGGRATDLPRVGKPAQAHPMVQRALTELQSYVERFTGPKPVDCGQLFIVPPRTVVGGQELQSSLDCMVRAAKDRKPSWTLKQDQGADSLVFQGLLSTTVSVTYRFWYDSDPCGGPGCPGRFGIERCDKPTIMTKGEAGVGFQCER